MKMLVVDISLVLWGIYFFLLIYRETLKIKKVSENAKVSIWKKFFSLFRLDEVFFLIVYLIYNNFAQELVLPYLYLVIMITNIVNILYDICDNYKYEKINKNEIVYYCGGLIVIGLIAMIMFMTKNFQMVFIITLILNILIPSYVLIFSMFKIVKKN